jgi:hypothetical protein
MKATADEFVVAVAGIAHLLLLKGVLTFEI